MKARRERWRHKIAIQPPSRAGWSRRELSVEAEAGGLGFDKLQVTDGIPTVCPQNRITRDGVSGDGGGEAWRTQHEQGWP